MKSEILGTLNPTVGFEKQQIGIRERTVGFEWKEESPVLHRV